MGGVVVVPEGRLTYRASFSLPAPLAVGISRVSKRLGISQSAFVTELLSDAVADIERLLDLVPPAPTSEDVRRLRGASASVIRARIREAQQFVKGELE